MGQGSPKGSTHGTGEGGRGHRRGSDEAAPSCAEPGPILSPSSHKMVRRCIFLMGRSIKKIRCWMFLIGRSIRKIRRWMFFIGRSIEKIQRWMFLIGRCTRKIQRSMFLIGLSIEKIGRWMFRIHHSVREIQRWMFSALFRAPAVGVGSPRPSWSRQGLAPWPRPLRPCILASDASCTALRNLCPGRPCGRTGSHNDFRQG